MEEVSDMMKHGRDSTAPVPFNQAPSNRRLYRRCFRFGRVISSVSGGWWYGGVNSETICLTTSKDIHLHGVQLFGCEGGEYSVSIKVNDTTDGSSLAEKCGMYLSHKDETGMYYAFDVLFDHPFCMKSDTTYEIVSFITGPDSWYGKNGNKSFECSGVTFTFSEQKPTLLTGVSRGQYPGFLFSF